MPDFLLELLSEEIPARMQAKARADLARLFGDQLGAAGLEAEAIETHATPRRLVLIARGLPAATGAGSEEIKGPRANAPEQALAGFLRKTGLTREQLVERDGILFALVEKPGRATSELLAEAIPAIVRGFPWPKSMRWGEASASTESLRWVRPLHGIVALLGEQIVEFEIAGVRSGAATVGHRFHHPGVITIGGAQDYVEKLRACHVIVDQEERRRIIADGAASAATAAGLTLVEDEGLLAENAGLAAWPVPLLGAFDPAYLDVPREVIQLTMRTNQKYFACLDASGRLAPNFVCVANIEAVDGGAAIAEGNRKVLAARLADAKFFWEHDLKVPLEEQAKKLDQIVFHEKLGTVADKVERVVKLALWLVETEIVKPLASTPQAKTILYNQVRDAASLAKADLVTQMVGEFPELQGTIGGYLAHCQGQPDEVADAISDHYKPAGQGDDVPTAPVAVAVSLADKLDTVSNFFAVNERPSGSRDPFALRRAALGAIQLILRNGLRFSVSAVAWKASWGTVVSNWLDPAHAEALRALEERSTDEGLILKTDATAVLLAAVESVSLDLSEEIDRSIGSAEQVASFFADRLKVQQREAGVRHDLIDAVFALGGEDDLVRLLARVKALQAFVETPEGTDLLAGYKRAANILKKENWPPSGTPAAAREPRQKVAEARAKDFPLDRPAETTPIDWMPFARAKEEAALIAALDAAEPKAAAAVAAEDYEGAMAALATLRAPVDAFFDKVTVNDPDRARRAARLDLLLRMRDAVHRVADFSRIEG